MKTAIKLALIYYAFQLVGMFLGSTIGTFYSLYLAGSAEKVQSVTLSISLLFSIVFMTLFLWVKGYIPRGRTTWSSVSPLYLAVTVAISLASIFLLEYLLSHMSWLPDILESTFSTLQAGWLGIVCIAILGPVLEELLYRGAITRVLLQKYNPTKAIVISAFIFGIIHINPIQVVSATIIGFLLAWIYYKTASLIPCILIHIINNSLSVYLYLHYPEVENTREFFPEGTYYLFLLTALIVLVSGLYYMNRKTKITSAS